MKKVIVVSVCFFIVALSLFALEAEKPTVGIAWRGDTASPSFSRVVKYLEAAGAEVVVLEKATTEDLAYYKDGSLSDDYLQFDFSLTEEAVGIIGNTERINVPESLDKVDLIVFTGGEDLSPFFYNSDYLSDDPIYNPDRDASDYLTLRLAEEKEIPVFGICRGMQLLAVYSGASLIIDLPQYFSERGEYGYSHRSEDGSYTFHSLSFIEHSFLSGLVGENVASSHHQAVDPENKGKCRILALCEDVAEAIEIPFSAPAFGIQFHPEYYADYPESREWKESVSLLTSFLSSISL